MNANANLTAEMIYNALQTAAKASREDLISFGDFISLANNLWALAEAEGLKSAVVALGCDGDQ